MSIKKTLAVGAMLGALCVPAAQAQTSTGGTGAGSTTTTTGGSTAGNTTTTGSNTTGSTSNTSTAGGSATSNASTTTGTTQDMFRVTFQAICRAVGTNGTNLVVTNITGKDIVAQAVNASNASNATNTSGTGTTVANTNDFVLVYNTTADAIQVVNRTNGNLLASVIEFGAGSSVTQGRQRQRFTYMFLPGEANAFGSALITERAPAASAGTTNNRATIFGRLQFALTNNVTLGVSNLTSTATNTGTGGTNTTTSGTITTTGSSTTATNFFTTGAFDDPTAKICSGFFFTSGRIPAATSSSSTTTNTGSATGAGANNTTTTGSSGGTGTGASANAQVGNNTGTVTTVGTGGGSSSTAMTSSGVSTAMVSGSGGSD